MLKAQAEWIFYDQRGHIIENIAKVNKKSYNYYTWLNTSSNDVKDLKKTHKKMWVHTSSSLQRSNTTVMCYQSVRDSELSYFITSYCSSLMWHNIADLCHKESGKQNLLRFKTMRETGPIAFTKVFTKVIYKSIVYSCTVNPLYLASIIFSVFIP